jgi:nicotinate-nucleotide pyrophosphorylase (carboxylating)
MNTLPSEEEQLNNIIDLALSEDTGFGDITSDAIIPAGLRVQAFVVAKEEGILAGGKVARLVFHKIDPSLKVEVIKEDGARLTIGDRVITISGGAVSVLKAERTALNFLGRMSGIATATAHHFSLVEGTKAVILDTRKTAPGMRLLDKYAVRIGGGQNHRMHLGDWILIKDNHIAALKKSGMSIGGIIEKARRNAPDKAIIEIEVGTVDAALEAAAAGPDIIMLDNTNLNDIKKAVQSVPRNIKIEASGGITPDKVRQVAEAGVDYISIGALTHSVKTLDFSLEID